MGEGRGGGRLELALNIFYVSAVDVEMRSLPRFKGNISGVQQTGEMMFYEDTSDKL